MGSKTSNPLKVQIGLWGPRGAGKTTYLAMLYHECLRREDWNMEPQNKETTRFIKDMHQRLFKQGLFPDPTQPEGTTIYQFSMTRQKSGLWGRNSFDYFELLFPDAAGEWFENYEKAEARAEPDNDPVRKLAECNALLLLVDPAPLFARGSPAETSHETDNEEDQESTPSYFSMLMNLIEALRGPHKHPGPILKYTALVFTKMDKREYWKYRERPEQFAQQVLTQYELSLIKKAFPPDHLRYFASSAVGVFQDEDGRLRPNCEESSDPDGNRIFRISDIDRVQPLNIFEPLEWLLDKLRAHS